MRRTTLLTVVIVTAAAVAAAEPYTFRRGVVIDSGAVSRLADCEVQTLRKCRGKITVKGGRSFAVPLQSVSRFGRKIEWRDTGHAFPIDDRITGFDLYDDRGVRVASSTIEKSIDMNAGDELRVTYTLTFDPTGKKSGQTLTLARFPKK